MNGRSPSGISLVEILVALAVLGVLVVLVLLAIPLPLGVHGSLVRAQMTQTLVNMRQLQLATKQMALDGVTMGNAGLGWPGDTGGSFSNWTAQLLNGRYVSRKDLCKLLSAPGVIVSTNDLLTNNRTAVLVYAVSTNSSGQAVFLSTANMTNTAEGGVLNPEAKPYGDKGVIVFRAAGDGAILQPRQVGQTNIIGSYVPLCR